MGDYYCVKALLTCNLYKVSAPAVQLRCVFLVEPGRFELPSNRRNKITLQSFLTISHIANDPGRSSH